MNEGKCEDGANAFTCSCPHGFRGDTCSISMSWYLRYHRFHLDEFRKHLMLISKSLDIDDCKDKPCNNGGTCQDGIASYACVCPLGFKGTDCELSGFTQYYFT